MRQCGYCRLVGHNSSQCETKKNQTIAIRQHVGRERIGLHNLLLANGYGVGAMVEVNTYRGIVPCVLTSLTETFDSYYANNIIEWRPHRYRKSVGAVLSSWTGNFTTGDITLPDEYVRFRRNGHITLVARPLEDLSDTVFATLSIHFLPQKPPGYDDSFYSSYNPHNVKLLVPSSETDIGQEQFMKTFAVHQRLSKDGRNHYLRLDPILP